MQDDPADREQAGGATSILIERQPMSENLQLSLLLRVQIIDP
jgi:hypothetical protein